MKPVKQLIASFLSFVVFSVLFLVSLVIPITAYTQSPWWFLEKIGADGPDEKSLFFVAMSDSGESLQQFRILRFDPKREESPNVWYHLPDGHHSYEGGPGEPGASVHVMTEKQGSQLIRVFVVGDSPWTSLSEYRVVGNRVYPLRYAYSVAWFLLGIPILLILFYLLEKPIQRSIMRLTGQSGL